MKTITLQKIAIVISSLAILAAARPVLAQTQINLQFTGGTFGSGAAPAQSGPAVVGNPGDFWNTVNNPAGGTVANTCTGTGIALLNVAGTATAVTLAYAVDYDYNAGTAGVLAGTAAASLMQSLAGYYGPAGNHTNSLTLSNLTAGTYDLYLYSFNQGATARTTTLGANGISAVCGPNNATAVLAPGANYVHLQPVVTAGGVLVITATSGAGQGGLNGFQLAGPLTAPQLFLAADTTFSGSSTNLYAGGAITFSASFGGTQPLTNQWKVDKGGGFVNVSAAATNATLTLTNLQPGDSGQYALFASNIAGATNSTPIAITVLSAATNLALNLQFTGSWLGSGDAPTQTGPAVIGNPPDVWNPISNPTGGTSPAGLASASGLTLVDVSNVLTTVTLDYVGDYDFNGGAFGFAASAPFAGSAVANLMQGFLGSVSTGGHADTNKLTLHNLPPGSYDLYLYSCARSDGQSRLAVFTANGVTAVCGPNNALNVLTAGTNYVHLTPVVTANGLLAISYYGTADAGQSQMNGLQLNGPVTLPTLFLSSDTTSDSPATNYAGRNVTFTAGFGGNPPPALQWKVDRGSGFVNVSASATNSSLTLANVQTPASGNYALFATNIVGVSNSTPVTLTVLAAPTNNFGANVNVQFVGTSYGSGFAAAQTGPAVIGSPGDQWNPVSNPNPVGADTTPISGAGQVLMDVGGIGTSVTLDYTGNTDFNYGFNSPFYGSGSPAANLMQAALGAANTNTATVTLHGVRPGTYDLYLYSSDSATGQTNVTQFTANGVMAVAGPNYANTVLTEGANYAHLTPTVTGNGGLNISFVGITNGLAQLNGLQLSGPGAVTLFVTLGLQQNGSQLTLTWPNGTLLEATNLLGPWTTNNAASPYTFTPAPAPPQKFYRVRVQ